MSKQVAQRTPTSQSLVLAYRRHEVWARCSGFAPMEWPEFKASRLANPLARAALAAREKTTGEQA